jgi:16S rRNA (cytosine967-C5)-methyltransferase
LSILQERLIDSAVAALRPGGILAYVTCSPHLAETRAQVNGALSRWPESIELLDTRAVYRSITGSAALNADGTPAPEGAATPDNSVGSTVQLWPHTTATDAMFIALFRKAAV